MIEGIFYVTITGAIMGLIYYTFRFFVLLFIAKIEKKNNIIGEQKATEKGYIVSSSKILLAFTIIFLSIALFLLCFLIIKAVNNNIIFSAVIIISSFTIICLIGGALLLIYYKNRKFFVNEDKIISQSMFLNQKIYYINQLNVREINGSYGMVFIVYNDEGKNFF